MKIQRLAALERTQPGITDFYRWLDGNRDRFQGQVYGPILLEVEVEDSAHAAYLENTCGRKPFSPPPPIPAREAHPAHACQDQSSAHFWVNVCTMGGASTSEVLAKRAQKEQKGCYNQTLHQAATHAVQSLRYQDGQQLHRNQTMSLSCWKMLLCVVVHVVNAHTTTTHLRRLSLSWSRRFRPCGAAAHQMLPCSAWQAHLWSRAPNHDGLPEYDWNLLVCPADGPWSIALSKQKAGRTFVGGSNNMLMSAQGLNARNMCNPCSLSSCW